jgi:hypothetical protein
VKLLGMTASAHDGEATNSIRLANRALRDAGLSWREALQPALAAPEPEPEPPPYRPRPQSGVSWRHRAAIALAAPDMLSQWEYEFLRSVLHGRTCSAKQLAIITRIYERVVA